MNVAGNYTFDPVIPIALVIVPYMLTIYCSLNIEPMTGGKKVFLRISYGICAVLSFILSLSLTSSYFKDHKIEQWEYNPAHYNTFYMNFYASALNSIIKEPDGYNIDALNAEDRGQSPYLPNEAPNIIVIMNESYTDISIYSDRLGNIDNPAPFWDSLTENTIHGYALSSVYGGNTANSEFEFLTGLSMINFPEGSVVYSQFISNDIPSLPRFLDNLGYTSTAMHPYLANGWRRNVVYNMIGFDNMYFVDDFNVNEGDILRDYVSDRCAYDNLIDLCEASQNGLGFYFLITMQNHGDFFDTHNGSFIPQTYSDDPMNNDLNNYLSLIHESDLALEDLINELKNKNERYIVLIFGDHQPSIYFTNANSNDEPGGTKWVIPYLILANYDIDPSLIDELDHTSDYTSINYLSLDLLTVAGIGPDSYYGFLYRVRDEIPSINAAGYRLSGEEGYHDRYEESNDRMLELYSYLTYDVLFDSDNSTLTQVN